MDSASSSSSGADIDSRDDQLNSEEAELGMAIAREVDASFRNATANGRLPPPNGRELDISEPLRARLIGLPVGRVRSALLQARFNYIDPVKAGFRNAPEDEFVYAKLLSAERLNKASVVISVVCRHEATGFVVSDVKASLITSAP